MSRAALSVVRHRKPHTIHVVVCIGCACDDLHACETAAGGACYWVAVDHKRHVGICSECAEPMMQALLKRHP
jgi:hypothetical protein